MSRLAWYPILFLLASPTLPAAASTPQEILAEAKAASGGDGWDRVRSLHQKVHVATSGLEGDAESWEDILNGRGVSRYALGPMTGADGYDGKSFWSQDASGQARKVEGGDDREGGIDEAYRRCLAYWYPQRHPGTISSREDRNEGDRSFHVLQIVPEGGRPFDLWIDAETKLIDRTVEPAAIETVTTFYSDYREVEGLLFPFAARTSNGKSAYDVHLTLSAVELNVPLEDALFLLPGPPPPDFSLPEGETSVVVPFELLNNHIYVEVTLNGKGPYRFLCDTGGQNVITPTLAGELGLEPEGAFEGRGVGEKTEDVGLVKVASLALGGVTLRDQLFAVFPLESFADVEGVEFGGLVGYEIFKRFVVAIDYAQGRLTLTLPETFRYQGTGTTVAFRFDETHPQVDGSIDGVPGTFTLDTGSRASLTLLGPFVKEHGLMERYAPKHRGVTGWGVGGAARGAVTRGGELRLGEVVVPAPVTELSLQTKGAFTDRYQAGNVGAGVLKRFTVIFDYSRQQVIFEPTSPAGTVDPFDRSGMWVNRAPGAFEVMDVSEGGPAAQAGLAPGDRILAVDGVETSALSLPSLRDRLRTSAPGTAIRLRVESKGKTREATLILRDLL